MSFPPIADLVPHSPPALALDELVDCRDGAAHARLVVRDGGLLVQNGGASSVVCLEYMAQTVAACLGAAAFLDGRTVRVGMVVACRRFTLQRHHLRVGERLDVRVHRIRGTEDISNFEGDVRDERGEMVAAATMTLVHAEKPPD
jgi:predicted hotdog family 3-hydroxylacyl-ACP dehydratase